MNQDDASLLLDIEQAFIAAKEARMFSRNLVAALKASKQRYVAEEVNEMWLANRLRPYGTRPKTLWIADKAAKGYAVSQFNQALADARACGPRRQAAQEFPPLMADDVARRAASLGGPDRELVFALQYYSWQPGGVTGLISQIFSSGRVATRKMQEFGMGEGQTYTRQQVEAVRAEIPDGPERFLLAGEISIFDAFKLPEIPDEGEVELTPHDIAAACGREFVAIEDLQAMDELRNRQGSRKRALAAHHEAERRALLQPDVYPARSFVSMCREAAQENLHDVLKAVCVKRTDLSSASPWWCPDLIEHLRSYVNRRRAEASHIADTEISRRISEGLGYCYETGEMTPIEGAAGIGKTYCAKAWCLQNPGKARYIEVPATSDEASFILKFAEAYGLGCDSTTPIAQVRERVEVTARESKLMMVLDAAHWLLPELGKLKKRPWRVAWLISALVNHGVPVALLLSSKFKQEAARNQAQTSWNWEQFDTRIGMPIALPRELAADEIKAVAQAQLPEGDAKCIQALMGYSIFTGEFAGMGHIVKRARFEADKAGREVTLADISSAIQLRMPSSPQPSPVEPKRKRGSFGRPRPAAPASNGRSEPVEQAEQAPTPRIELSL